MYFFRTPYEKIVISKEKVVNYVKEMMPGYQIKSIQGDGLCIIRSFQESMKAIDQHVQVDDILAALRSEILQNFQFYGNFCEANVNILMELDKFLKEPLKYYNTDACDTFLMALGNAFKCKIVVFQASVDRCWTVNLSKENEMLPKTLYFARGVSDHLDPVVPLQEDSSDSDIEILRVIEGTKPPFCLNVKTEKIDSDNSDDVIICKNESPNPPLKKPNLCKGNQSFSSSSGEMTFRT